MIGLNQLFGLLLADIGLLLVVLVDHLDRPSIHLAADVIERQFERIARVGADRGGRAAESIDEPDLDRIRRDSGRRERDCHRTQ